MSYAFKMRAARHNPAHNALVRIWALKYLLQITRKYFIDLIICSTDFIVQFTIHILYLVKVINTNQLMYKLKV